MMHSRWIFALFWYCKPLGCDEKLHEKQMAVKFLASNVGFVTIEITANIHELVNDVNSIYISRNLTYSVDFDLSLQEPLIY